MWRYKCSMAGEAAQASCQRCTSASHVGPASDHVTSTYDCAILMWTFCHIERRPSVIKHVSYSIHPLQRRDLQGFAALRWMALDLNRPPCHNTPTGNGSHG